MCEDADSAAVFKTKKQKQPKANTKGLGNTVPRFQGPGAPASPALPSRTPEWKGRMALGPSSQRGPCLTFNTGAAWLDLLALSLWGHVTVSSALHVTAERS